MPNHNINLSTAALREIVIEAWRRRDRFDLRDAGYGRIHWGNLTDVMKDPCSYYFFLAGMVSLTSARRIVEIGTHHGGSARALCAGLGERSNSRVLTFDINSEGASLLAGHPIIRALCLDGNSQAAFEACVREFGEPKVDLVYIDADHTFWPTFLNFLIYGVFLNASWVIIDDITLNSEMEKFWNCVRSKFGQDAIDASEVIKDIRGSGGGDPGFGLVRMRCTAGDAREVLSSVRASSIDGGLTAP